MAPPPSQKLKQSSIDSFLKKSQPAPPSSSDYESIRLQTIRRNQEFLQKLGIPISKPFSLSSSSSSSNKTLKSKSKPKPNIPIPSPTPLRRSSRKRGLPADSAVEQQEEEQEEVPALHLIDSSVFRYTCDPSISLPPPSLPLFSSSSIFGFQVAGKPLRDPSLPKIYTLDVSFFTQDRFLVAAAGHGGFISVFGGGESGDAEDEEVETPLMSWKASRSWISGVGFVEKNPMLLLSTSNDGKLILWDIKKQQSAAAAASPPVIAAEVSGLHSGGIFSMSQMDELIATSSKDSSVGVSRITAGGEVVFERNVSGHHRGAIRGVCFGDNKDKLADCGADGLICVLDMRLPQPCTLTIESEHSTCINTVEWSNTNNFLLLTASKDPSLLLYDIRSSAKPFRELQNHFESISTTWSNIYRPTFVGGNAVATPGHGSKKISLYSVDEGALISQGFIGYDANLIKFTGTSGRLWAAGKHINQLLPLYNRPIHTDIFE